MKYKFLLFLIFLSGFFSCSSKNDTYTDIIIVGGGASGTAAAISAARMGASVVLVEETEWLGGMLTAAGVSATDGNHRLPSGIWGEFRERIYAHYGGPGKVATGWVSNTHFEPDVADSILKVMVKEAGDITVLYNHRVQKALQNENRLVGVVVEDINTSGRKNIFAEVSIEATELGDLLALTSADYYIGQDPISLTNEELAPEDRTLYIQDLTYVAILKNYGKGKAPQEEPSDIYDPEEFNCMCKELCDDESFDGVDCMTMLNYAKLPNDKYLINWPNEGNDYYTNAIELSHSERELEYEEARKRTRDWIYHLQTVGGNDSLGIDTTIFPTTDGLALIPYHRESRRIKALNLLTANDLKDPYRNSLYSLAVAVGDYPLDHHHKKNPLAHEEYTPETSSPIPSFSIPASVLIPENLEGLIAAEKSIGVSHLANGSTRLQPVVLGIGQAAGVLAAVSVEMELSPRDVPLRELQERLLESNCWLLPYLDITPEEPHFIPLQKMGLMGLLKGHPVPYLWANQTWIYPDSLLSQQELTIISEELGIPDTLKVQKRKELALLLDDRIDLFEKGKDVTIQEESRRALH